MTSSSFRWASHDSWSVAISSVSSSLCSVVNFAAHAFLSNVFTIGAEAASARVAVAGAVDVGVVEVGSGGDEVGSLRVLFLTLVDRGLEGGAEDETVVFGGPKNEVREAWPLGFFGSEGEDEGRSAAFLLRLEAMERMGRRRRRKCCLKECRLAELNW